MKIWIISLLDFVLLDIVLSTTSSHLYTEVDGNLIDNYRIFLSIDVLDSTGLLLYAIDSELNQFTIERKILFNRKNEVIYNFNGHEYKENEINDNPCPIVKYKILIQLINGNLLIGNENKIILRNIFNRSQSVHFEMYPIPKTVFNSKKTHFWIGNISPHIGFEKRHPLKQQLIGCVNGFFIHSNHKRLQYWSSGGDEIFENCWHSYIEIQCNQGMCKTTENKVYNLDCRISVMNVKEFCYKNLLPHDEKINSFVKLINTSESTTVKLIWKQKYSENYCLIEIILSNISSILFYTNKNDEIFYYINAKSTNNTSIMLEKSFSNSINHLIITLDNHQIKLQISNGTFYKSYNDDIFGSIERINIGYSQFSNICTKYQGDMIFRYKQFQFKPVIKDPIKADEKIEDVKEENFNNQQQIIFRKLNLKIPLWIIFIFIGVIFLLILAIVIKYCRKRKPNIKEEPCDNYNLYEQGNIQQRNLPNAPQIHEIETAVYSTIEKDYI